MKTIMLCAICSVTQGNCAEDCAYCTQSAKAGADITKFKEKSVQQVVDEAKMAYKNHALGFCLVTSGARLNDKKTDYIASLARAVHKIENECYEKEFKDAIEQLKKLDKKLKIVQGVAKK